MSNLKNAPLVSVLMTVYNREKYIDEAIKSVLSSTYKNWELIVVDDQSKDRSLDIARSYAEKDSRIQVYLNSQNLGDYPNRNKAASYAKGKYLKYVDSDDMLYPYGLEQLVFYMEQFPEAGYGICTLNPDKKNIYPFQLGPKEAYERHYFKSDLFHRAPLSAIINRNAFNKTGGFTGKRMLGDFEMWNLLSQKYPVVLMPHGIIWYREHEEQEMTIVKADPMERFKYLLLSKELLRDKECPLSYEQVKLALKKIEENEAQSILSAAKHHSFEKAIELFRHSELNLFEVFVNFIRKRQGS